LKLAFLYQSSDEMMVTFIRIIWTDSLAQIRAKILFTAAVIDELESQDAMPVCP
jgi:hypothetical protein